MSKPSFKPPEPIYVLTPTAKEWMDKNLANLPPGIVNGRANYIDEERLCGAENKIKGGKCRNFKGFKTNHAGVGPCFRHDKDFGRYSRRLLLDFIESERLMGVYGDPIDIDPHTALLMEVQRTSGHVEWLRQVINDIHTEANSTGQINASDISLVQYTPMGIQPSVWIQMYQEERKHLVRVCTEAIKAGVSEKTVQIAQDQAKMLAMVLKSFLLDNRMSFTPQQRILAPTIIRELINGSVSTEDQFPNDDIIEAKAIQPAPKKKQTVKK